MSLETRIVALAQAIGSDVKTLTANAGSLSALTTTAKSNLVAAINELNTALASAGVAISDTATTGDTSVTWSANKITAEIAAAKTAVTNSLVNGAAAALDTLNELAAALGNDPAFATTIAADIANRVRYDSAQTLTGSQQAQARVNIAAADAVALTTLTTNVGDTTRDLAADYATAKA
ncbi:MAG: hypothetical protein ACOYNF_19655 [Rhodoferax sp.]